ncbi:MAG: hypothetical protein WBC91_02120 [Phototrophicaceae bacterium]
MSSNYSIQQDLKETDGMVSGLSDYVRGDQLYGSTGGGFFSKMPSLTVGALVMRLHRLDALQATMSDKQKNEFNTLYESWQTIRKDWRSHYEHKIMQEVESRLESMETFFRECAESQQSCYNNYRPEIQKRTIIQALLQEMSDLNLQDSDLTARIKTADGKLRTYLRADEFQWSDTLTVAYPQAAYWWLYQKPPKELQEN